MTTQKVEIVCPTAPTELKRPVFTFDSESGSGAHPFTWEDNSACVLKREVGQRKAVDSAIGAHPPLVVWFQPDAVFLPNPLYVRVGELHLKGGRLSFKGFLVS